VRGLDELWLFGGGGRSDMYHLPIPGVLHDDIVLMLAPKDPHLIFEVGASHPRPWKRITTTMKLIQLTAWVPDIVHLQKKAKEGFGS